MIPLPVLPPPTPNDPAGTGPLVPGTPGSGSVIVPITPDDGGIIGTIKRTLGNFLPSQTANTAATDKQPLSWEDSITNFFANIGSYITAGFVDLLFVALFVMLIYVIVSGETPSIEKLRGNQ